MDDRNMDDDRPEYEKLRRAYEQDARGRQLKTAWFVAMVVLWIIIWAFVGASGIVPRALWVGILLLLVAIEFAIALFGPRNRRSGVR